MRSLEQSFHYPRYDELPDGLVFLEDIVALVNKVHEPLPPRARNGKTEFTKAMASNYVKAKLTAPAVGKKYNREHVARILFASTIKFSYSAEDVLALTHGFFDGQCCQAVHDRIAGNFNRLFSEGPHAAVAVAAGSGRPECLELVCAAVALKAASLSD